MYTISTYERNLFFWVRISIEKKFEIEIQRKRFTQSHIFSEFPHFQS